MPHLPIDPAGTGEVIGSGQSMDYILVRQGGSDPRASPSPSVSEVCCEGVDEHDGRASPHRCPHALRYKKEKTMPNLETCELGDYCNNKGCMTACPTGGQSRGRKCSAAKSRGNLPWWAQGGTLELRRETSGDLGVDSMALLLLAASRTSSSPANVPGRWDCDGKKGSTHGGKPAWVCTVRHPRSRIKPRSALGTLRAPRERFMTITNASEHRV